MDMYAIAAALLGRSSRHDPGKRVFDYPRSESSREPVTRLAVALVLIAVAAAGLTYAGEAFPRLPVTLVASTAQGNLQ